MNHKKWMAVIALAVTALILTHLPVSEADAAASASDFQTQGSTLVKYRGTEERVTIPDTVEVVGESAFENNQKVQFVVIPKSVKRLDAYVFWGCNNLEEVVLGKGLTAVDEYSFAGCTGLKQITIPEVLTIQELADAMKIQPSVIVKKLFMQGKIVQSTRKLITRQLKKSLWNSMCSVKKKK